MIEKDSIQPEKKEITGEQQLAALCLARGATIVKTAKEVGVAPITIERWKRLPHFMAAVHQAEDELYNDQLRQLKKNAGAAITTLVRNMSGKVSAYVQVQAASKLLDLGLHVMEVQALEQEVEQLKELIAAQGREKR